MNVRQQTWSRTRRNWWIDVLVFVVFLVSTAPRFTGIAVHEWLGIAFGAGILMHLLLHWEWMVTVIKRLFKSLPAATRINAMLNVLLFVALVVVVLSGLAISESALPALGHSLGGRSWRAIHALSADAILLLVAAHIGLHWPWIVSAIRTYVIAPLRRSRLPAAVPAEQSLEKAS